MTATYSAWASAPAGSDLVFLAGMTARAADGTAIAPGDMRRQAEAIFDRMAEVLADAGSSLEQLLRLTIYVTDVARLDEVRAVRARRLRPPFPAATAVEVRRLLDAGHVVEVDAVAWRAVARPSADAMRHRQADH